MKYKEIKILKDLKRNGYTSKSIKQEMRDNLLALLSRQETLFSDIIGFDETVIPDLQRALLSRHNIIFLGLRGQAKTRIARAMVHLLDEYIPVIEGSELNEDPLNPISYHGREMISRHGDETPIAWVHKSERYTEKLATPDVTIADLIGDVDPIKAANLRLNYSDERVIHFGLLPRSHRCVFVINELPDLQARIQVALFNILQERDVQIRGFKMRLPLDIQFVFTANPEDYTNRGSIVTPLKDRIESQILTHYPKSIEISKKITHQEARILEEQYQRVEIVPAALDLIEQVAFQARDSEYVDEKSGVSARLTISAFENFTSTCERRSLITGDKRTACRLSDLSGIIPSITGKIELVYEGQVEGPTKVAHYLIGKAIKAEFLKQFPDPERYKRKMESSPYHSILNWFREGNTLDVLNDIKDKDYQRLLNSVIGLSDVVKKYHPDCSKNESYFYMEMILHAMAEMSYLSKFSLEKGTQFKDLLTSMLNMDDDDDQERYMSADQ